jgi:predicted RNA-binding protein with PUA-like domain
LPVPATAANLLAVSYWLLKTEPSEYAWEDLAKERTTAWTGVSNPQAVANLRAMKPGDRAVIYHSGERRAVGVAEVVRSAYAPAGGGTAVDLRAVAPLAAPVPLEALKAEPTFEGSVLLRQGRLSVVPLSPAEWRDLEEIADVIARTGGLHSGAERF